MKALLITASLLLLGGAIWVLQNRDGRIYKKATKIVRPFIASTNVKNLTGESYSGGFTDLVESNAWQWYQPELVSWKLDDDRLDIEVLQENVWWRNWRGPMFYTHVKGDIDVRVFVQTRKASNPEEYPDKAYQFGGLILRDPLGDKSFTSEYYVFNVIGYRGSKLTVETKSTADGLSQVEGHNWLTGDAELRIVRKGAIFQLYARPIDEEVWQLMQTYDRPDLPEIMQLGIIAYAYSAWSGYHDLKASFTNLKLSLPQK
jgi:hypothetical protein